MVESLRYNNPWIPYFQKAAVSENPSAVFNDRIQGDSDIGRDMLWIAEHLFEDVAVPRKASSPVSRRLLDDPRFGVTVAYWQQVLNSSSQAEFPEPNSPHHNWGEAIEMALRASAPILTRADVPHHPRGRELFKKVMGVEPEEFLTPIHGRQ